MSEKVRMQYGAESHAQKIQCQYGAYTVTSVLKILWLTSEAFQLACLHTQENANSGFEPGLFLYKQELELSSG